MREAVAGDPRDRPVDRPRRVVHNIREECYSCTRALRKQESDSLVEFLKGFARFFQLSNRKISKNRPLSSSFLTFLGNALLQFLNARVS